MEIYKPYIYYFTTFILLWSLFYINIKFQAEKYSKSWIGLRLNHHVEQLYRLLDKMCMLESGLILWLANNSMVKRIFADKPDEEIHEDQTLGEKYIHDDQQSENIRIAIIKTGFIGVIGLFAVIGFFLPGEYAKYEKISIIKQIITYNYTEKYNQAIIAADKTRKFDSPLLYAELGKAYLYTRNYTMAESMLLRSIELLPKYDIPHRLLAELYLSIGKPRLAAFEYTRAQANETIKCTFDELIGTHQSKFDTYGIKLLFLLVFASTGAFMPVLLLKWLHRRRIKQYNDQLPDALYHLASSLRVTPNLLVGIKEVYQKSKKPLREEFGRVIEDFEANQSMDDALKKLKERMPTVDNKIFISSLPLQKKGAKLDERLNTIARTIHERKRVLKKIETMSAEGFWQAIILSIMPFLLFLILHKMNPEVYSMLYTTNWGLIISLLVIIFDIVGLLLMFRIIRVKV